MLCGHANCIYWVLDAGTGKVLKEFSGGFAFIWSHDRRYAAHRVDQVQTYPTPFGQTSILMFNDRDPVYPPTNPKTGQIYDREIIDEMRWSPDDAWISFPEVEYPSYDSFVVLVSTEGKVLRDSLPVDVNDAVIKWSDDHHFQIHASGRTFRYVVNDGNLREIVEHKN